MSRKNIFMEFLLKLWPNYAAAATLTGLGLSMARFDEFGIARSLFWIASIFLGVTDFVWQLVTDTPAVLRVLNGVLTAAIVFVVFPLLFVWLRKRQERMSPR
jgi:hypothetical protein